jgi:hypothetical protein
LRFSSQNLPDMEDVSEALIERAFEDKAIGMYAHLWLSDEVILQAGSRGTPSTCCGPPDDPLVEELRSFIRRTGSEPWTLEYIDGVARKEYQARGDLTLEQVKAAFVEYLRSGGDWRQDHDWEELDTSRNPFPSPTPDVSFELAEPIPNDALLLDHLPPPDADWPEVWRLADTFNGFKHWGSVEACAEVANERWDSTLTELRTCLFFECRRCHHYGLQPDEGDSPYLRGLVEKIRAMVAAGRRE